MPKFNYKQEPKKFQSSNEEYKAYRDAVWDYLIEHSDIASGGALFVKFHTRDRGQFESHVESRMKYDYHRGNPAEKKAEIERRKQKLEEVKQRNYQISLDRKAKEAVQLVGKSNWFKKIKDAIFKN